MVVAAEGEEDEAAGRVGDELARGAWARVTIGIELSWLHLILTII